MKVKKIGQQQSLVFISALLLCLLTLFAWPADQHLNRVRGAQNAAPCTNGARFSNPPRFAAGVNPTDVISGDFNKDGLLDLAVADQGARLSNDNSFGVNNVSILAGNGRGEFANVYNVRLDNFVYWLARGDFNGDGNLDLATASYDGGLMILLGRGDWTFAAPVQPSFVRVISAPVVADFNADGVDDLAFGVATSLDDGRVLALLGKGDGVFAAPINYDLTLKGIHDLTAGDFNGDGKSDLLVVGRHDLNPGANTALLLNDGAGNLARGAARGLGVAGVEVIASGDLNGDGKLDVAFASRERGLGVVFNNGAGGFGEPVIIPTLSLYSGDTPPQVHTITDLNDDGALDIVAFKTGVLLTFINDKTGGFNLSASYEVPSSNFYSGLAVSIGDFNRDGKTDLATLSTNLATLSPNAISILSGLSNGYLQATSVASFPFISATASLLTDINGDGKLDLIAASTRFAPEVAVLTGDGAGNFLSPKVHPVGVGSGGSTITDIAVADFNKDGRLDIVTVGASVVGVMLATPTGDFAPSARNFNTGAKPAAVIAADFNGDSNPDLAVANYDANTVSFLAGDGRGEFAPAVNTAVWLRPNVLAVGDFNNDGKLDLAVTHHINGGGVSILTGDGRGGFNSATIFFAGVPTTVVAADFDQDGKLDLAVASNDFETKQNILILLGNGDASFRPLLNLRVNPDDASLLAGDFTVGDFTGDGKIDLVTLFSGFQQPRNALLFVGDGTGKFARGTEFTLSGLVNYVAAGDVNGDNLLDLVFTDFLGVKVARNSCNTPLTNALTNVSAASFTGLALAPDAIAAAFSARLATATASATSLPLPTELAGTRVRVRDAAGVERNAPLFFVAPMQVNYLVPAGTAAGLATVTVTGSDGQAVTEAVLITPTRPGLFTANADGAGVPAGYLLRIKADGSQTIESIADFDSSQNRFVPRPISFFSAATDAPDQLFLVLFGTGLRNRAALTSVEASVAGFRAEVLYAGPQGSFAGLDQINLRLVPVASNFLADVLIRVEGKTSNTVKIHFR